MSALGVMGSAILMKCESRGQQLGLAIGMLILAGGAAAGMWFFMGLGEAAMETSQQARDMGMRTRRGSAVSQATVFGWAGMIVCALVGVIFVLVSIVNFFRFMTGTGLAPQDDTW